MPDRVSSHRVWRRALTAVAVAGLLVGCGSGTGGPAPVEDPATAAAALQATPTPTGESRSGEGESGGVKEYPELDLDGSDGPRSAPPSPAATVDGAPAPSAAEPTTASPTFSVPAVPAGQPATNGSWSLTLHGLTDPLPPASEFATPDEGSRFVALDAEVVNVGDDKRTFSASFSMELMLQDGSVLDVAVATLHEPAPPGGEMAPGESQRGLVVFEVPSSLGRLSQEAIVVFGRSFATTEPVYLAVP